MQQDNFFYQDRDLPPHRHLLVVSYIRLSLSLPLSAGFVWFIWNGKMHSVPKLSEETKRKKLRGQYIEKVEKEKKVDRRAEKCRGMNSSVAHS